METSDGFIIVGLFETREETVAYHRIAKVAIVSNRIKAIARG